MILLLPVQNARLHAVIAQLQSSLDEERALAVDEDAELVALLSAKLAARSLRRAETFDRTCAAASGAVDEVARSREAQVVKRSEQMGEMEERNEWLAEAMKGRLGEVEQRGEEGKKVGAVCHTLGSSSALTVLSRFAGSRWFARRSPQRGRGLSDGRADNWRGADRSRSSEWRRARIWRSDL